MKIINLYDKLAIEVGDRRLVHEYGKRIKSHGLVYMEPSKYMLRVEVYTTEPGATYQYTETHINVVDLNRFEIREL